MPRDDKEILVARQLDNDVLGNAFAEIAALVVLPNRAERQNGDRRPAGQHWLGALWSAVAGEGVAGEGVAGEGVAGARRS